jgi:hypothetical protein
MKKLFLIFLLLGGVILPGCGDYEDEAPRVVWTSPSAGTQDFLGKEIMVSFNTEMQAESLTLSTIYVKNESTEEVWPLASAEPDTDCQITISSVAPGIGLEANVNQTFLYEIDDACLLTPASNLTLIVSQNVRSKTGQTLKAPYRVNFSTAN